MSIRTKKDRQKQAEVKQEKPPKPQKVEKEKVPLSGEELVIGCLLDPHAAKSRNKAHGGGFARHEIQRHIQRQHPRERLARVVESWLPAMLTKMLEDGKLLNVNEGLRNVRPMYKLSPERVAQLVNIGFIKPQEANPHRLIDRRRTGKRIAKRKKVKVHQPRPKVTSLQSLYRQVVVANRKNRPDKKRDEPAKRAKGTKPRAKAKG